MKKSSDDLKKFADIVRRALNRTSTHMYVDTVKNFFYAQTDYTNQMYVKTGIHPSVVCDTDWHIPQDAKTVALVPLFDRDEIKTVQFKNPHSGVSSTIERGVAYLVANVYILENFVNMIYDGINSDKMTITHDEHEWMIDRLDEIKKEMWNACSNEFRGDLFDLVD